MFHCDFDREVEQNWWPNRLSASEQDYSLNIENLIEGDPEFISCAVEPSGLGEMQPLRLFVEDDRLIVAMSGGQPGRLYATKFLVRTTTGETFGFVVYQYCDVTLPGGLIPMPPSPTFGPAITWPTLIGWAGVPIFGRPRPPSKHPFTINLALIGGL